MSNIVKTKKSIKATSLATKSNMQLYCKLKGIDTLIVDRVIFLGLHDIWKYSKCIKNLILDPKPDEFSCRIDLEDNTEIKNISFLDYPMFEGITIPLDILNTDTIFTITSGSFKANIKKINVLYNGVVDEIKLDENISSFYIGIKIIDDERYLFINLKDKYTEVKNILYDKVGNKKIFYENKRIEDNKILDLREYQDSKSINFRNDTNIDELIITPQILKNYELNNFKNIHVNKFKILSSNDMKLDPSILELDDVKVSIYKNKSNYDDIMHNKIYIYNDMYEKYIYIDDNNELKIVEQEKDKEYKFLCSDRITGVLIKDKKLLKFDLIINNKCYNINKIFINWYLCNKSMYDKKIIPSEVIFKYPKENIFNYNKDSYKVISDYIFDTLLEEIIKYDLADNFDNYYKKYLEYLKHLEVLLDSGLSHRALLYLHKNDYDNITGIKYSKYINLDEELIDTFNNLGKKLTKKKG